MKLCPRCSHEVQEDQAECPNCGVIFAKWDAAHSSSPTPVSTSVSAAGKFTLRHLKYLGLLVLVILNSFLFLGEGIERQARGLLNLLSLLVAFSLFVSLFRFAKNTKIESKRSFLIFFLIAAAIFVGMGSIGMSAMKDRRIKVSMVNVQLETVAPILTALEKYYQKNGRFPVSTTATSVTPSMSGTLDKGSDVWTSMGLDRYPVFRNTSRGSLVSQLDYTSDATGSTVTLTLTMANFGTDSIDGKIISVTPSPEKEAVITWISNCSFGTKYCLDPNPFCRRYPSSSACR